MLPTFVIGLREGLEATLIVVIIATFLSAAGRRDSLRAMWAGVGVAVLFCIGFGVALQILDENLPQRQQEQLETLIALVAAAAVTYMIVWMRRHARNLRGDLQDAVTGALARGSGRALVGMAFFAVIREGLETAVFLTAAFQQSARPAMTGSGAILGIVVAVALGLGIYRGGVQINLVRFFRFTGVVLVLVAGGLLVSALHSGHEAGWIASIQGEAVDLTLARRARLDPRVDPHRHPRPAADADDRRGARLARLRRADDAATCSGPPAGRGRLAPLPSRAAPREGGCPRASHPSDFSARAAAERPREARRPTTRRASTPVSFALTDAGCDPSTAEIASGPTTFEVENKGAAAVTEFEVIKDKRILGEVENLAAGLSGEFSLTLQPGTYELYCPNGTTAERGTLTVTGETVASADAAAAKKAVTAYRAYVIAQAAILQKRTTAFTDAVRSGNVAQAKKLFPIAREPYERIEPVAESFGDLDPEIDARAGDVPAASWTGFHRLEKMLWVDKSSAAAMTADREQARHRRGPARQARQDGGLPDRADRERRQGAHGRDRRLEGDRRGGSVLAHGSVRLPGQRRGCPRGLRQPRADPEGSRPVGRGRRSPRDSPTWSSALAPYRAGDGWVLYTTVKPAERRDLSRAVDKLAEPLSKMSAIVAQ